MKIQKIRLPNRKQPFWTVVDAQSRPVMPITEFLRFQADLGRSPNTIRAYAYHLKWWWTFLTHSNLTDWQTASTALMAEFIHWLRSDPKSRQPSTISTIITAVVSFYDYHDQMAERHTRFGTPSHRQQFVRGLANGKRNPLVIKQPSRPAPQTLTPDQVETLIAACQCQRDKLLLTLLYQTGMRIGQALGLRHQDIDTQANELWIVPRDDNINGARAKTRRQYMVPIGMGLVDLYTDYLVHEYPDKMENDYVFVILSGTKRNQPLEYGAITSLFQRLAKKTGIITHPHIFRHTYVTELIRRGVDPQIIQECVGHQSIQTTLETYAHITASDLKRQILPVQTQALAQVYA